MIVDTIGVGLILIAALFPNLAVFTRKIVFMVALYLISVMLLLYLGNAGPGLLYLLGITVFSALTMGRLYAYLSIAVNTIVSIFIGVLISTGYDYFALIGEFELGPWIAVSSNLLFLSAVAALLIPILFSGIQSAYFKESTARSRLESEQRWLRLVEAAIENTSEAIIILEAQPSRRDGRQILYANGAFYNMTGYPKDEVIGNTLYMLDGPYTSREEKRKLFRSLKDNKPYQGEFANYKKNGELYWVQVSFTPVKYYGNKYTHWICVGRDITESKDQLRKLNESLVEKETLLMEIHHRVKNNLAVVSSMMQLQAMEEEDEALQQRLFDSVVRIRTMVTIHEMLYESKSFSNILISENISKLVEMVLNTISSSTTISTRFDCTEVLLNVNQAIPVSLIANEIITNAVKHAFDGQNTGTIEVSMTSDTGMVKLQISDDGIGLPEPHNVNKFTSLGFKLIDVLCQQIDADYRFISDSHNKGTKFEMMFQKNMIGGQGNATLTSK